MAKIQRPGSGRTKGSFSFVNITLEELNNKFADKTTPIRISRKFAEQMGFKNLVSGPANALNESIVGQTPETKVAATVVDLNDE